MLLNNSYNFVVDENKRIYAYGLEHVLKPVNDIIERASLKGVIFEDNISSRRIDTVLSYFKDQFLDFIAPLFLPVKITIIIQIIDRHIGIQRKRSVCIAFERVIMERLVAVRKSTNGCMSVSIDPLTHKEKRTLINKIIGDINECPINHSYSFIVY